MAISTIRDLPSPWRIRLMPANFDTFMFHCESGSRENGRRIVTHEFPKKDLPYSEDMGRRAIEFSVRGYIIQYPADTAIPLYQRDYTLARDALLARLETGVPGPLQLPLQDPVVVRCTRYRLTEEERFGGYCVFDMSFVELGVPPFNPTPDSYQNLLATSQALRDTVLAAIKQPKLPSGKFLTGASLIAGGGPFSTTSGQGPGAGPG